MNTCSNCASWTLLHHTGSSLVGIGECRAARQAVERLPHTDMEDADLALAIQAIEKDKAVVKDGSGYFAALFTKPEFYCAQWSAKQ